MTKEEAVARIKDHIEVHHIKEDRAVKITQALNMAIEALERTEWHYPSKGEYPTERDWYLGIFEEPDTGFRLVPVVCDYVGKQTKTTTKEGWIINHCTDTDNPIDYYINLKCVAWQYIAPPKEEV